MSLFRGTIAVLNTALRRVGGVKVTVRCGNASIDDLVVVPLDTRHDGYGGDDVAISARDQDWLVWAAEYAVAGQAIEPSENHEIDWIDEAGKKRTFAIRPRGDEGRCYRHTDQTRLQLRVYSTEAPPNSE